MIDGAGCQYSSVVEFEEGFAVISCRSIGLHLWDRVQCGSACSQSLGSDKGTESFASPNFFLRSNFYKKCNPLM